MKRTFVRLSTSRGSVVGGAARRRMVVEMLDRLLARKENLRLLKAAFQRAMNENPSWFLRKIVMPLAGTQDAPPTVDCDSIVEWRALEDGTPPGRNTAAPHNEEMKS